MANPKVANSNFELRGPNWAQHDASLDINLHCHPADILLDSNANQMLACQLTRAPAAPYCETQSNSALSTSPPNAPPNTFSGFTAAFPSLPNIHGS
jgi:hypothetical protein